MAERTFTLPDEPTDVKRIESLIDGGDWWQYSAEHGQWYYHGEDMDEGWLGQSWHELFSEHPDGFVESAKTPEEKAIDAFRENGGLPARPTKALIEAANVLIASALEKAES